MDINLLIPILSFGTQLITVIFAIRLMRYTEKRVIAIVFILSICLMAFRRVMSLADFFTQGAIIELFSEIVGLAISLLILFGIILITRIIKSEEENKNAAGSAEMRYRTLFAQSPDGVLLMNARGDIVDFNEVAYRQLGYTREEFSKLKISDIDLVESPADIKARFEKILKEGKDKFEVKHKTKQGEIRTVSVIIQKIELSGQTFFHAIWRDITERKKVENKLVYIMKAVESSSDAIGISDVQGHHFYQNKALSDLFGYATAEELEAAGGGPVVVKDPEVAKEMFDNIMQGKSWAGELEMVTKAGRVFPAFERADAIKDNDGNLIGLIGIITDITERRKTEARIKWVMDEQKVILDNIGVGVLFSIYRKVIWANKSFAGMLGYTIEELVGKDASEFYPDKKSYDQIGREGYAVIERGEPFTDELQLKRRDGSLFWCHLVAQAVTPNNPDDGTIWVLEDVTERRQLEEARKNSEEKYRIVADFTYDWEFWIRPDDSIVYSSPSCERITGYSSAAFTQDPSLLRRIVHPDDATRFDGHRHGVRTGNTSGDLEFRIIHADGATRWIEHFCQPLHDAQGIFIGTRGSNRDITLRKDSEEERERTIRDLQEVLAKVKTISGLMPVVCSSCKKIRDDKGSWQQIETYVSDHSEAEFSHGTCPDCATKVLEEIKKYKARNSDTKGG